MDTNPYVTKQKIEKTFSRGNVKPILTKLDVELTELCNNNCIHCCINLPANDLDAKNKELSAEEIKRILKEALSLGCISVRFTGGEPLLRGDFEELYVFARRSGLKVLIFTNATLMTTHLVKLFSNIPPLEKMEVSVYGMKKASYEAVTRVNGSFEAAFRGINLLLKNNVPFVVKGAILPSNKNEIDEFFSCGSGVGGGCVDAYGNFQPCLSLRHPDTVYNLKNGSLKDALENFFPKIREKKATNPEYLRRCAKCFLKGLCEQCPAKSWMEHGTLDTPVKYLCEVAHVQARFLELLKENEFAWEVKDWEGRIKEFTDKG